MAVRFGAMSVALAVCLLVGCGEAEVAPLPTAKVSGSVTLDGKPMPGGIVRFNAPGQPVKDLPVTNGAFSGDAFIGRNTVDVLWEKEGGPNPMDPSSKLMINAVDAKFSGPTTPFSHEVTAAGASDLKFDVTSAKPAK